MGVSTFTVYSSSDANGPGPMFGSAGDLLRVLDLCLVNGYTGKAAPSPAWTKPFANSGNLGCYKQPAGAGFTVFINDNGPNVTSTAKEAWATGWESLTALSGAVGVGIGQFPIPSQLLTTGHVVVRKSALADSTTQRRWILFADSYTFYLFINTGDQANTYAGGLFFGDIFSLKGSSDAYRCIIVGQATENGSGVGSATITALDQIGVLGVSINNHPGHYMARTYGGGGASVQVLKQGDFSKTVGSATGSAPMAGLTQTPNGPDGALYLDAVGVAEVTALCDRGRMRGMYHLCHPIASFADGQTFQGINDFAGKSFQLVVQGPISGMWCMEISATVEVN